jgi:amino acid adenylation domain-containing protein
MMMLNHHLADDNTTLKFLVKEIEVHLLEQETSLSAPLPFRNFVAQARLGISREEHEAFFRKMLGDVEEPTAPFGLLDVQGDGSGIEEGELALDSELAVRLRGQARRLGVSAASLCHLAWAMVLSKVSGRKDVVFGTVLFGRMQGGEGGDRVMGLFINTLPLRIDLGEQSVEAGVHKTHALLGDLMRHEHAPLALAQRCGGVPAPAPLFSALFNYRHSSGAAQARSAEAMKAWEGIHWLRSQERTNYPLTLSVDDLGEGFMLTAQVQAATGPMRVCEYMRTALQVLVQALETAPATAVRTLDVLPASERRQVLYEWNDTGAEYPRDKCVHELFEEQVERVPETVAVVYEDTSVSYRELNERANQLAWRLRELGVGPEARVGLLAERSLEMVVGLLAVLKAGAAYVPLDPDYPSERLSYMLESAQVKVLLTQEHLREKLPLYSGPVLELDGAEEQKRIREQSGENLNTAVQPENLAYLIYTSGSTGTPKGVMNSHGGLLNRLLWMQKEYRLEPGDVVLQKTPFSFDVSVWEFLWPLLEGAKLVVARPGGHQDPGYLATLIEERQITTLHFVPSMLAVFLDEERPKQCESIRRVVCSGEALPAELAQRCLASLPWAELHNLYGPTEAAIDVTYWKCLAEDTRASVPIGKAIANIRLYVVDEAMNPVPVGVPGELCLGGVGLARGYWGRGDLTAERFVPDGLSGRMGERLYRTGDLVLWLVDGNLEYLGRLDQQVKIRGFRIELGEIEAALERHPSVTQSVVLAREDKPGDKRLVAYVVADQEAEEDDSGNKKAGLWISELREHLLGKLPEYMVPTAYVQLKRIPLTPNGKIDRKGLPEPGKDIREQEYVGPRNATEETLCRLWQEVSRRERVGIHDNFFNIGGHSLLAVQVISRIKQAFTVEMPLSVLFAAPTVARMAEHIAAVNEPDRSQSSPVLVNIQPQGSRAPFFCVHAVGGQVIGYAELSQELGLEQPFYGLQSPPANYFPESGVSIEQLATLYNQEIRSVQPRGPYLLSGWSMGGLVAWEMAQQLRKEGEIISLLALIDAAAPPKYREAEDRDDEISMLARFAMDMSRLAGRDPGPLVEQFLQAAEQDQWKMVQETLTSSGVLAPKTAHAEMTALLEVYTRNFRAMNNYSIQTSKQAVIYFRASETPERFSKVWTKWSGGGIQFHSVPGDHFTMLRRPGVRIIAETLQRYISMNSNNELRAVSSEMSPPELIGLESQHTP